MNARSLPMKLSRVHTPPIKCQGIKSKLVNFILSNIKWNGEGTWYEPFLGSGVVTFNAVPTRAVLSDINPHVIELYSKIQRNEINAGTTRSFLQFHGKKLSETPDTKESYYYEMRDKFNDNHDPLYFLFLNRSCFNGLIRFNEKGNFNTPFGKKPGRFSKSYITKIVNQVQRVQELIISRKYQFRCCKWDEAVKEMTRKDFAYIDPPYYGRHATYYENWTEKDALELAEWTKKNPGGHAISLWMKNKYRENDFIPEHFSSDVIVTSEHYYFIGSTENLRTSMTEALIVKPSYAVEKLRK